MTPDQVYAMCQRAHDNASPPEEPIMLCKTCGRWRCETDMSRTKPELCADCAETRRIEGERDDALRLVQDMAVQVRLLRDALTFAVGQLDGVKSKSGVHASSLACDLKIAREALKATNPNAGLEKSVGRWDGKPKAL